MSDIDEKFFTKVEDTTKRIHQRAREMIKELQAKSRAKREHDNKKPDEPIPHNPSNINPTDK